MLKSTRRILLRTIDAIESDLHDTPMSSIELEQRFLALREIVVLAHTCPDEACALTCTAVVAAETTRPERP